MYSAYKDKKCFLLDLDGTVYLGATLIPAAKESVSLLRERAKVFFVTNNSSRSREDYAKKLTGMGIPATSADILSSSCATAFFLKERGLDSCMALGTSALKKELALSGVEVKKFDKTAVLGFDTDLNYENLCRFTSAIANGAYYVATHPDINCPTDSGFIPDAGAFMALIQKSTGRLPDVVCGKPYPIMAKYVCAATGCSPSETVFIGDRIYTDIKFAADNGMTAALVLTGEGTEKELKESGLCADVFPSIHDIAK